MSTANIGLSTTIKFLPAVATADPGAKPDAATFTSTGVLLAQVQSAEIPPAPTATIDITNFDSPSNGRRESIGGLLDSVSVTLDLVYVKTEMAKYWTDTDPLVGLQRWIEVKTPDGSTTVFLGTFGSPGMTIETDDAIRTSVSITLDNDPEFTAG